MNRETLIKNAESCTGCSACVNACPCKAVSLAEDEYGFVFPEIDGALCTDCGICTEVCAERNNSYCTEYEQECWYGQSKNEITLKKAASGGLFTEFAQKILEDGGVVFGAAMSIENGVANVYHKSIESEDKLHLLQNSKYVQSDVGFCYAKCKDFLDAKRRVLFSGTPCQIAGLKAYLGNREYKNLITIDIICHGVPSLSFFNRYLQYQQEKSGNRLASLKFREKDVDDIIEM